MKTCGGAVIGGSRAAGLPATLFSRCRTAFRCYSSSSGTETSLSLKLYITSIVFIFYFFLLVVHTIILLVCIVQHLFSFSVLTNSYMHVCVYGIPKFLLVRMVLSALYSSKAYRFYLKFLHQINLSILGGQGFHRILFTVMLLYRCMNTLTHTLWVLVYKGFSCEM